MSTLTEALIDKDLDACEKCVTKAAVNVMAEDDRCKEESGKTVLELVAEASFGVDDQIRERWSAFADRLVKQGVDVVRSIKLAIEKKSDVKVLKFLLQRFGFFSIARTGGQCEVQLKRFPTWNVKDTDFEKLVADIGRGNELMKHLMKDFVPSRVQENNDEEKEHQLEHRLRCLEKDQHHVLSLTWPSSLYSYCPPSAVDVSPGADESDIIMYSLRLGGKFKKTGETEPTRFSTEYKALSMELQQFAADLVEEVRSEEELKLIMDIENDVESQRNAAGRTLASPTGGERGIYEPAVLSSTEIDGPGVQIEDPNSKPGSNRTPRNNQQRLNSLAVLKEATVMGLKLFVASPKCQHHLENIIEASKSWRSLTKSFPIIIYMFCFLFSAAFHGIVMSLLCLPYVLCSAMSTWCNSESCPKCFKRFAKFPYSIRQ